MSCNCSGDQHWVACECTCTSAEYVRVRGLTLINTSPPPPKKKDCLEGNIIPCTFKMIICTRCWNIRGKEIRKTARVLRFNQITKLLLYFTKVMRFYFKQNERFKLKKVRARQDSNLESSDPKSDAISIRPRGPHRILLFFWQSSVLEGRFQRLLQLMLWNVEASSVGWHDNAQQSCS